MKKRFLTKVSAMVCATTLLTSVFASSTFAMDEVMKEGDKITLSKDSILKDGGFENAKAGKDLTIDWMMPIAGKFEVVEDSSLAIEGKKLIKAMSAEDIRIAIPEVKMGYKIHISFYYKNSSSNGLWSKLKDIDNKETIIELTGANGFSNPDFNSGWHHVTEKISVGESGDGDIVPGTYHYAMGCFGDLGYMYFDGFDIIVEDENGKVVAPPNGASIGEFNKNNVKLKAKKKLTLKFKNYGLKSSKKVTCKTSNKKIVKIVKKTKKAVTVKGLKKGKAKITLKQGKKKAVIKVTVKK